jgi:hypothetical protein
VAIVVSLFVLFVEIASKTSSLDPVNDIPNIVYWFIGVPAVISLPYYLLLKHICKGLKWLGFDHEERELHWKFFQYGLVLPIILILVIKIVSMMVSETAAPLWAHYGPILDTKVEYYQPIWADHVNNSYVWLQNHLTFLPPLESLQ